MRTIILGILLFCVGFVFGQTPSNPREVKKILYTIDVNKDSTIVFSDKLNSQLYKSIKSALGFKDEIDRGQYFPIKLSILCYLSKIGKLDSVSVKSYGYCKICGVDEVKKCFSAIERIKLNGIPFSSNRITVYLGIQMWQGDAEFYLFGRILGENMIK